MNLKSFFSHQTYILPAQTLHYTEKIKIKLVWILQVKRKMLAESIIILYFVGYALQSTILTYTAIRFFLYSLIISP